MAFFNKKSTRVFISYCRSTDTPVCNLLERELTARGYMVAIDTKTLPAGDFEAYLALLIEVVEVFLVVLSDEAVRKNSPNQEIEVNFALKNQKHIVPVIPASFDWREASSLSPWIIPLSKRNSVVISYDYQEAFLARLQRFIDYSSPSEGVRVLRKRKILDWKRLFGNYVESETIRKKLK